MSIKALRIALYWSNKFLLVALACFCLGAAERTIVYAQSNAQPDASREQESQDENGTGGIDTGTIARKLSSLDPLERQHAAEELARLAAVDQLKMVAGYRLQEKDARVRLALDWALYRMGKTSSLFNIVRELDSSRHAQAAGYLAQLDGPDPLYIFIKPVNDKTRVRLFEVLARLGDSGTLDQIRPYLSHYDPKVAAAAQFATSQISNRLMNKQPDAPTRPRQVGTKTESAP